MNSENSLVLKFLLSLQPELLIQTSFLICLSFLARSPVINTLLKISFLNFITFPLSSDVSNRAFFFPKMCRFCLLSLAANSRQSLLGESASRWHSNRAAKRLSQRCLATRGKDDGGSEDLVEQI